MFTTNQILQQGRYRIVGQNGQNGSGFTYEAFDNTQNTSVILKETVEQSQAQTAPLTSLNHEALRRISDIFTEADGHYLVAEKAADESLGEMLEKNKTPFSLKDVSNWANDLLDALNYLHTRNPAIIHGEVRPQNIELTANRKIKLSIFNLAKTGDQTNAVTQTFDPAVLPYLPLERIWNGLDSASRKVILTDYDDQSERILEQTADARSDLYSFAATLYYLLTARIPADALTRSIEMLEGNTDPLQSPSAFNSSIPKEVSDVLMKSLEIKRENRFSSAVIMRQVLRTAFVRVQENSQIVRTQPKMEDDTVLEIPAAAPKPVHAPRTSEMQNNEQMRQLELMKQQLREAEEHRLEAERRAAEAEKRLLETEEKHISVEPHIAALETVREAAPIVDATQNAFNSNASDDLPTLLEETPKEGGAFKKIAAAAAGLIVLGGAGFGIWTFTQSKPSIPAQTVTTSNAAIPAPTAPAAPIVENTPAPNLQASTETTRPEEVPNIEPAAQISNPAPVKTRNVAAPTAPQTAQVKKPAATLAKTADKPKKVTLDDLLKDN